MIKSTMELKIKQTRRRMTKIQTNDRKSTEENGNVSIRGQQSCRNSRLYPVMIKCHCSLKNC